MLATLLHSVLLILNDWLVESDQTKTKGYDTGISGIIALFLFTLLFSLHDAY
jgi:hypothetical protein